MLIDMSIYTAAFSNAANNNDAVFKLVCNAVLMFTSAAFSILQLYRVIWCGYVDVYEIQKTLFTYPCL